MERISSKVSVCRYTDSITEHEVLYSHSEFLNEPLAKKVHSLCKVCDVVFISVCLDPRFWFSASFFLLLWPEYFCFN
jgi:hypothetical protein